jgi:lipoprotein-releasing system permease protein
MVGPTIFHSSLLTPHSSLSNEVLVSSTIASRLRLAVGDKMRCYFWCGDTYRSRAFAVSGIYNTDLAEMDEVYIVGDLRQVQRLNNWDSTLVGGYELLVDDFNRLSLVANRVVHELPYDLSLQTLVEAHPALFSWLDLLNSNITLILLIMSLVCAIAIVSALLIMIFEKSRTIGLLKALGATDASIRRIFLLKASRLIVQGILIGDAIALALCFVQSRWQVIKLDAESYSMTHVPIDFDPWIFLLVSLGAFAVCLLALLLPAAYISRISPAQSLKSE